MGIFISTSTIEDAYKELTSIPFKSPAILHTFLILKGTGYNSVSFEPVTGISEKSYLPAYKISGLFSPIEESPDRYDFISPFEMKSWAGQAPSEKLKKWVTSRIKNNILGGATTWRKIVADDYDGGEIRFKHDYINEIANEHLGASKIPLASFALWANRFTEFREKKSIRQIIDLFISEFKITDSELNYLFTYKNNINPSFDSKIHDTKQIRLLIGKPTNADVQWLESKQSGKFQIDTVSFTTYPLSSNSIERTIMNAEKINQLLSQYYQIILSGPPGTSKSFLANEVAKKFFNGSFTKIQFHPKYTYQDFIGGYVVRGSEVAYEKGILLNIIESIKNKPEKHLLIIDEINRANVGQVFGETIQLLDRDNETQIRIDGKLTSFKLPENLFIIATMNSADRSLGAVDFAIRRRFGFAYCAPDPALLNDHCQTEANISLTDFLRKLNRRLNEVLKNPELAIGHTFFLLSSEQKGSKTYWNNKELANLFNHKILPMVQEYCHGNLQQLFAVLGDELPNRMENENFVKALESYVTEN